MGIRFISLDQFSLLGGPLSLAPPEEDGETFYQNAIIKARYYADQTGMPCLADDSGLMVKALGGEPGVLSARYGDEEGISLSDTQRAEYLLSKMQGIVDRSCAFVVSLVLAKPFVREVLHYEGRVEGVLTGSLLGDQGFGYDPIFLVPSKGKTLSQMAVPEKGDLSHRGIAARALKADILRVLDFLHLLPNEGLSVD
jgi:XTP/dITP diphosphohydrolase